MKRLVVVGAAALLFGAAMVQGLTHPVGHTRAAEPTEFVYATDHEGHALSKIKLADGSYTQIAEGIAGNPDSVAYLDTDDVVISSSDSQGSGRGVGLLQVNLKTGAQKWLARGTAQFGYYGPYDITLRPDKSSVLMSIRDVQPGDPIFEGCSSNARVAEYNFKTKKLTTFISWKKAGISAPGNFDPNGLVFLPDGSLYLAVRAMDNCFSAASGGRILKIDPKTGNKLGAWPAVVGSVSNGPDGLTYNPVDQMIYAGATDRVIRFNTKTHVVSTVAAGFVNDGGNGVDGVESDENGQLFLADICEDQSLCNVTQAGVWQIDSATGSKKQIVAPPSDNSHSWDDVAPLSGFSAPPTKTPSNTPSTKNTNTPTLTRTRTPSPTNTRTPSPTSTPQDAPWTTFGFDASRSRYNDTEHVIGTANVDTLALKWSANTSNNLLASPAISNSKVVIGLMGNAINAYNVSNGKLAWTHKTTAPVASSPTLFGTAVYAGARDGTLYALNASTGTTLWTYQADSAVDASPAVDKSGVYFGTILGTAYGLDLDTGDVTWTFKAADSNSFQASAALANNKVYLPSYDGYLYVVNATTGKKVCSYDTGNVIQSAPAVVDGTVYLSSVAGGVFAMDAGDCSATWQYTIKNSVTSSPAVAEGIVYVGTDDGVLTALNATTGKLKWTYQAGGLIASSPAVANGVVYFGSWDKRLYALDAAKGSFLWGFLTGKFVASSPAVASGAVYVGSGDGQLYSFTPNGNRPK